MVKEYWYFPKGACFTDSIAKSFSSRPNKGRYITEIDGEGVTYLFDENENLIKVFPYKDYGIMTDFITNELHKFNPRKVSRQTFLDNLTDELNKLNLKKGMMENEDRKRKNAKPIKRKIKKCTCTKRK